jgi:hypothetical protein
MSTEQTPSFLLSQVERLKMAIGRAEEIKSQYREKLDYVIMFPSDLPDKQRAIPQSGSSVDETMCPLAVKIREMAATLEDINTNHSDMLKAIDL